MAAQNNKSMRLLAEKKAIKLFDVGEGIEHTLLPERSLIKPDYLVAGGTPIPLPMEHSMPSVQALGQPILQWPWPLISLG